MYDAQTRLAIEVSEDVAEFFQAARKQQTPWADVKAFQTRVRRNIRLAEAPSFGQSIFQYAPDSNGAQDYRHLAEEILAETAAEGVGDAAQVEAGADTAATSHGP
jgi:chromosome partitioning protein